MRGVTWWMLALAAAAGAALLVWLVRRRGPVRATRALRAGEIWWADVPYEDGTGSKVRPCLVLRVRRGGADVLKITSQDRRNRRDHVEIPTRSWDRGADRNSFLDLTDPIRVPHAAFADRAGDCDPALWRKVKKLHSVQ
jgi:PemK-like, MazF-like toxin of type II toxin-antitoxin system